MIKIIRFELKRIQKIKALINSYFLPSFISHINNKEKVYTLLFKNFRTLTILLKLF